SDLGAVDVDAVIAVSVECKRILRGLNVGEEIVHVRCGAGGQLADGCVFLRMTQLRLQAEAVGGVAAVAMDDLAGGDREKGPAESPPFDADFLPELALTEAQTFLGQGDRFRGK